MKPEAPGTATIERKVNKTEVRLVQGDLTALPVDAFVFYAREDLELGAGYGAAIQMRGGSAIKKELEEAGRIGMGESVVTTAGTMNARHIIHACGPKFNEPETERKLRDCMLSALRAADKAGVKTLAFPPMGAGFYGVPLDLCAAVMLDAIQRHAQEQTPLEQVIVCVTDRREFKAFEDKVEDLLTRGGISCMT